MTALIRQTALICRKDLIAEAREMTHGISVFLFGILLLLLFSFAFSVEPDLMRKMAGGLFWLAIFFASILTLNHSFRRETEDKQWEGLLLLGADPKAIFLGKMLANLLLLLGLQAALLVPMTVLFDIGWTGAASGVLVLGSLGLATLGTLYAGLTANIKEAQVLLPLLLFPMMVPVLLAAVHATNLLLAHDLFGQQAAWLKLLVVFDGIFVMGSVLCADWLFDAA
ncbi:MAG: heme exporter protein CcmB [Deltaproteobacteria bacterium]|nr:heme exporter protein CcmB [Deltaproteobacteria bacterium]